MKKVVISIFFLFSIVLTQNNISPILGMRFYTNDMTTVNRVIGFQMNLNDNMYSGFDTDSNNLSRIFIGTGYVKLGIGSWTDEDDNSSVALTIGGTYNLSNNLNADLEYLYSPDNPYDGDLRLGLGINF